MATQPKRLFLRRDGSTRDMSILSENSGRPQRLRDFPEYLALENIAARYGYSLEDASIGSAPRPLLA